MDSASVDAASAAKGVGIGAIEVKRAKPNPKPTPPTAAKIAVTDGYFIADMSITAVSSMHD